MAFLQVEDIHKSFGQEEVLKGISFGLEKGEVLSIIGSSGGGKTTLLRSLNQLIIPDKGIIKVNDEIVFDASEGKLSESVLRDRRLHFGLVFQQFNLFPQYNVKRNLTLAAELLCKERGKAAGKSAEEIKKEIKQLDAKAYALLVKVGLENKITAYPGELSGGQQQRVAIARALMLSPDILCFDEPTSALDPELTGEVLKVIGSLKSSESTMVIVTHEMEFARKVSDKVIFMADGVIEEMGTPAEIFDDPKSAKLQNFLNKSQNLGIDDMESGFNAREWAKVAQDGEECLKDNELIRF
ncbi:MAG: amino acid ABC transporter ATP-binding protein [Lachnospiraceae bacterium]|jgi:polar amino acid transport system ATP-binding protein|nr:amino acid ABC transporter ATP-binding protein [Lachnospiraceae bacterium]